ncbi:MAG: hypothetical protein AB2L09_11610 [Coriobacteriia bacterium]
MCIGCNPICGHCRPPTMKAVICPECGTNNLFDIVIQYPRIERHCSKCGADLTKLATPKVVRCKNTGLLCANPCYYHTMPPESCVHICRSHTPPPERPKVARAS